MKTSYILIILSISMFIQTSYNILNNQQKHILNRNIVKQQHKLVIEKHFAQKLSEHLPPEEFQNQTQKDAIQQSKEDVVKREEKITEMRTKLEQIQ